LVASEFPSPKKQYLMKTIATTFAIAALALLGAAPQAEARHGHKSRIYISGHLSCGSPIYSERYFVGYDDCGNEIWRVRRVRQEYREVVRERYAEDDEPTYRRPARYERDDEDEYEHRSSRRNSIVVSGSFFR
jgi:hypothetical protein